MWLQYVVLFSEALKTLSVIYRFRSGIFLGTFRRQDAGLFFVLGIFSFSIRRVFAFIYRGIFMFSGFFEERRVNWKVFRSWEQFTRKRGFRVCTCFSIVNNTFSVRWWFCVRGVFRERMVCRQWCYRGICTVMVGVRVERIVGEEFFEVSCVDGLGGGICLGVGKEQVCQWGIGFLQSRILE